MPKQTRLNFAQKPTTASKRRKRDSDDETDEQNERPPQRSKTTGFSSTSLEDAENELSPAQKSGRTKPKLSPHVESTTATTSSSKSTTKNSTPHITLSYKKASLFLSPRLSIFSRLSRTANQTRCTSPSNVYHTQVSKVTNTLPPHPYA